MSDTAAKALALRALAYKSEHRSGNYPDIANKPKLNNVTINGNRTSAYYKLPLLAETGHSIDFHTDSEFNLTVELLNKDGDILSSRTVDLPVEGMVMSGHYKETSEGKWLVLVLLNGNEIEIPLEDLIDELATTEYVKSLVDSEAIAREEDVLYLTFLIDSEGHTREEQMKAFREELDEIWEILDTKQDAFTLDSEGPLHITSEGVLKVNELTGSEVETIWLRTIRQLEG